MRHRAVDMAGILIGAVALHSILLGLSLLAAPNGTLAFFGWEYAGRETFFPQQGGCFLVVFGVVYLAALRNRAYAWIVVWSKAAAAAFLAAEFFMGRAPFVILAAGIIDGAMGVATAAAVRSERRGGRSGRR